MAEQSKLSQSITVMFVLAALVVAGVTYLLLQFDPTKPAPGVADQAAPVTQEQPPTQQLSNAGSTTSEPAPANTMDTANTPAPVPMPMEQGSIMPPAASGGEGEKPVDQSVSAAAEQPLSSVAPGEPETSPAASTLVPMADTATKPDQAPPASTPGSSEPMTATSSPTAASTSAPAGAATTNKEPEPAAAAFESSSSTKGDDAGLNKLGLRDAKWLLSQDPSNYSIQVIAVKGDKELSGFLDKNAALSKDQMAYFKRKSGGQDWLVLTYGVYPSLKAAVDAMNALPPMVKERHPWVRKLAYVHKDIQ